MIVPQYWAEARIQKREKGRQVTIRRYGWSNESQADAEAMAESRAAEAIDRAMAGESVTRVEPRRPYNGAEGVPIREEIVSRHGTAVVTRNSYGAHCLNTPDVLFADIDFPPKRMELTGCLGSLFRSKPAEKKTESPEDIARQRVEAFAASHRDWNLRVYRTPAGLRIMATHQPFDPRGAESRALFDALQTDPIYVTMCVRQNCFRARVSPKPWRIGVRDHVKPAKGVWPVHPDVMPVRESWVASYERAAQGYASCRFITTIGSGAVHAAVYPVLALHDQLSRAETDLPIA
jgi:hypothetical protein